MGFDDVARSMKQRHGRDPKGAVPSIEGIDPAVLIAEAKRQESRSDASRDIVLGVICLIGGIAVTALTHSAAVAHGGGTYVMAYGPIIFGVIKIGQGLARMG